MIHYHGGHITPIAAGAKILMGRHALVSFSAPSCVDIVAEVCQSFVFDNGAFSAWRSGKPITDWNPYYQWVREWKNHPAFDWAIIPDIIDGGEEDNDRLIDEWPDDLDGVPVWHLHESLDRLSRLSHRWRWVSLGSSGRFKDIKTRAWWGRMEEAMEAVCDNGRPRCKLHGLRMLDPEVFTRYPFASADSNNVAINMSLDKRWTSYRPATRTGMGIVVAERVEAHQSASSWVPARGKQLDLFRCPQ